MGQKYEKTIGVYLNLDREEDRLINEAIAELPRAERQERLRAALYNYLIEPPAGEVAVDNTEVLAAIAQLSQQVSGVQRRMNTMTLQPTTYNDNAEAVEDRLLAEGMSEEALVALKTKVFKPGMRLDA